MTAAPSLEPADLFSVVIVDDHDVFAQCLTHTIGAEDDFDVVGTAASLAQARTLVERLAPDLVVMDVRLPDGDGIEAIPQLSELSPRTRFVVLTASEASRVIDHALSVGALGVVCKTRSLAELTSALRSATLGESVVSSEMIQGLTTRAGTGPGQRPVALTGRERAVLDALARGLTNREIADQLFLSVHTTRNHVANIATKLDARSKLEILAIAVRHGLLPDLHA